MVQEHPLRIDSTDADGAPRPMLGILSLPPAEHPARGTAVLIVVGGEQYRVGSHRQFVRLARALALAGYPVLRFDLPGMGDSPGEPVPFDASACCIAAAVDALHQHGPEVERVVLWGLCDGASASLLYVQARPDARVAGLALLNPWVRTEASLARAQVKHYYRRRLMQASFWRKLATGAVGWPALRELGSKLRHLGRNRSPHACASRFQDRMGMAWQTFPGAVLLLLSGRDLTAREFEEHARTSPRWLGWQQRERLTQHTLAQADHTCSDPASARQLEVLLLNWLQSLP